MPPAPRRSPAHQDLVRHRHRGPRLGRQRVRHRNPPLRPPLTEMKPRHSTSLLLVWRVADLEARNLKAPFLDHSHLLLGLCKIVDLDLPALVSKDTPDRDAVL